jgi:hypothetical protein
MAVLRKYSLHAGLVLIIKQDILFRQIIEIRYAGRPYAYLNTTNDILVVSQELQHSNRANLEVIFTPLIISSQVKSYSHTWRETRLIVLAGNLYRMEKVLH